MKTITLTQEQFDLIQESLSIVYTSCQEGFDGTWNSGSEEGKKGFIFMKDELLLVAKALDAKLEIVTF